MIWRPSYYGMKISIMSFLDPFCHYRLDNADKDDATELRMITSLVVIMTSLCLARLDQVPPCEGTAQGGWGLHRQTPCPDGPLVPRQGPLILCLAMYQGASLSRYLHRQTPCPGGPLVPRGGGGGSKWKSGSGSESRSAIPNPVKESEVVRHFHFLYLLYAK